MSSRKHSLTRRLLLLSSFSILSSCTVLKDILVCSPKGSITLGSICSHTNYSETTELSFDETIDVLDAQPVRPDPRNPGKTLPEHGAGIFMSSDDYAEMRMELQEACRELGPKCSIETKQTLARLP